MYIFIISNYFSSKFPLGYFNVQHTLVGATANNFPPFFFFPTIHLLFISPAFLTLLYLSRLSFILLMLLLISTFSRYYYYISLCQLRSLPFIIPTSIVRPASSHLVSSRRHHPLFKTNFFQSLLSNEKKKKKH